MKDYSTKEELISDLKLELKENSGDEYILNRLDNPERLLQEFKEKPDLRLQNKNGDSFFVWKNHSVKIRNQWEKVEYLIAKLSELY